MRNTFVSGIIALTATGCASTQLNYNALDLAGTVDDLITKQIVHNLGKFVFSPTAIPTQVSIASGSVTTTGQVSASLNTPLNKSLTATTQIASSITQISTGVLAASTIMPTANDQWSQNWGLSPITDADQMRRLSALYRYVTHPDTQSVSRFCSEFPLVSTQGSASPTPSGSSQDDAAWKVTADIDRPYAYESYVNKYQNHVDAANLRKTQIQKIGTESPSDPDEYWWKNALILDTSNEYKVYLDKYLHAPNKGDGEGGNGKHVVAALSQIKKAIIRQAGAGEVGSQLSGNPPPAVTSRATASGNITMTAADALFLVEPSCIICSKEANRGKIGASLESHRDYCPIASSAGNRAPDLYKNPKLRNGWLTVLGETGGYALRSSRDVHIPQLIGSYGVHTLYTTDIESYHQFVLFVLEAAAQGSTSGQSGKTGATSNKPQGPQAAPQLLLQ